MTRTPNIAVALFLLAGVVATVTACGDAENVDQIEGDTLSTEALPTNADTSRTIYNILQEQERFSEFVTAIDSAGLDETLSGPGPFTVFAPTNEAFAHAMGGSEQLLSPENRDDLRGILLYHISGGSERAGDLQDGASIQTLEGGRLNVTGEGDSTSVGGAVLMETDIHATNGVVHVVGSVLRPGADA